MENIALVIAAILGTTGIASIANSLTSWGKRSKLRNSIRQMNEDLKFMDTPSAEQEACKASLSVQALELASYSLIKMTPSSIWLMGTMVATIMMGLAFGVAISVIDQGQSVSEFLDSLRGIPQMVFISYIVILPILQFLSLQSVLSRRRHRFVSEAWKSNCANREMILQHSYYLRNTKKDSVKEETEGEQNGS